MNIDLDLTRKTWACFGYKESGKSTLAKTIATEYGSECLYYDTLHEIPGDAPFHAYKPDDRQSLAELESVIRYLRTSKRYRLFILDEANRFARSKPTPLPQEIADLNDWCRHPMYNLSVGYIARRPTQLNQDLTEICDYLMVFHLGGKNDRSYCDSLRAGLGDAVLSLPKYHFCLVNPDRTFSRMSPVTPPKSMIGSDTRVLTTGRY